MSQQAAAGNAAATARLCFGRQQSLWENIASARSLGGSRKTADPSDTTTSISSAPRLPSNRPIDHRWDRSRGIVFSSAKRPTVRDLTWSHSNGIILSSGLDMQRHYATRPVGTKITKKSNKEESSSGVDTARHYAVRSLAPKKPGGGESFVNNPNQTLPPIGPGNDALARFGKLEKELRDQIQRLIDANQNLRDRITAVEGEKQSLVIRNTAYDQTIRRKDSEHQAALESLRSKMDKKAEERNSNLQLQLSVARNRAEHTIGQVIALEKQLVSASQDRSTALAEQRQALEQEARNKVQAVVQAREHLKTERTDYDTYRKVYDRLAIDMKELSDALHYLSNSYFRVSRLIDEQPDYVGAMEKRRPTWFKLQYPQLVERLQQFQKAEREAAESVGGAVKGMRKELQDHADLWRSTAHNCRLLTRNLRMRQSFHEYGRTDLFHWVANDLPFRNRRDEIDAELDLIRRRMKTDKDAGLSTQALHLQTQRATLNKVLAVHTAVRDREALSALLGDSVVEKEVFVATLDPTAKADAASSAWLVVNGDTPFVDVESTFSEREQKTVRQGYISQAAKTREMIRTVEEAVRRRVLLEQATGKDIGHRERELDEVIKAELEVRKAKEHETLERLGVSRLFRPSSFARRSASVPATPTAQIVTSRPVLRSSLVRHHPSGSFASPQTTSAPGFSAEGSLAQVETQVAKRKKLLLASTDPNERSRLELEILNLSNRIKRLRLAKLKAKQERLMRSVGQDDPKVILVTREIEILQAAVTKFEAGKSRSRVSSNSGPGSSESGIEHKLEMKRLGDRLSACVSAEEKAQIEEDILDLSKEMTRHTISNLEAKRGRLLKSAEADDLQVKAVTAVIEGQESALAEFEALNSTTPGDVRQRLLRIAQRRRGMRDATARVRRSVTRRSRREDGSSTMTFLNLKPTKSMQAHHSSRASEPRVFQTGTDLWTNSAVASAGDEQWPLSYPLLPSFLAGESHVVPPHSRDIQVMTARVDSATTGRVERYVPPARRLEINGSERAEGRRTQRETSPAAGLADSMARAASPEGRVSADSKWIKSDSASESAEETLSKATPAPSPTRETAVETSDTSPHSVAAADTLASPITLTYQIPAPAYRAAATASRSTAAAFWTHNLYQNPAGHRPLVHYCKDFDTAEHWARTFLSEPVLGFDTEWEPRASLYKSSIKENVSLIQIASEAHIALFHIALFKGETAEILMPPSLRHILESDQITKAGVNIQVDSKRLSHCFGVDMKGQFELSHLYKVVRFSESDPRQVNRKVVNMAQQVQDTLLLPLKKDEVRMSAWSRPLNSQQATYAAADAYAGFRLFHALDAKRKEMRPMPPRPAFYELQAPLVLGDGTAILPSKFSATANGAAGKSGQDEDLEEWFDAVESFVKEESDASAVEVAGVGLAGLSISYPTLPKLDYSPPAPSNLSEQQIIIPSGAGSSSTYDNATTVSGPATQSASKRSLPPSTEVSLANAWLTTFHSSLPADYNLQAKDPALRTWHMWHRQRLSIAEIASLLREPPLSVMTVASYIMEAIKLEDLAFEKERLEVVVGMMPSAALGRYQRVVGRLKEGRANM